MTGEVCNGYSETAPVPPIAGLRGGKGAANAVISSAGYRSGSAPHPFCDFSAASCTRRLLLCRKSENHRGYGARGEMGEVCREGSTVKIQFGQARMALDELDWPWFCSLRVAQGIDL